MLISQRSAAQPSMVQGSTVQASTAFYCAILKHSIVRHSTAQHSMAPLPCTGSVAQGRCRCQPQSQTNPGALLASTSETPQLQARPFWLSGPCWLVQLTQTGNLQALHLAAPELQDNEEHIGCLRS